MTKIPNISPRRVEEAARSHDVVSRAKAASPVSGGTDRLGTPSISGSGFGHVRSASDIC